MEATDKETAGQEAEEEPEEGIYVFIKKHSFKQTRWLLIFTIFLFTIYLEAFLLIACPQRAGGCGVCLSMTSHKYKSRKKQCDCHF